MSRVAAWHSLGQRHEAGVVGDDDELDAVAGVELGKEPGHVGLDGREC